MITNRDSFVRVEKGISLYTIEYILLYHHGYMYHNGDDPHQDTQHKLNDLSDGDYIFHLYGHDKGEKWLSYVSNPIALNNDDDYWFGGIKFPCIMASKLLRNYKINKIKKQIKN